MFPGSNGKSFQSCSKRLSQRLAKGEIKTDVIDPVLGNGCATPTQKGINWVPIRPATNSAFFSAALQWIIENEAYNKDFLAFPNYDAGVKGGYASCTNASHLVISDESHPHYLKFITPEEAGLDYTPENDEDGKAKPIPRVVVDNASKSPTLATASDAGDFLFEGEINGIDVRSSFLFLKDGVYEKTIEEYSEICKVPVSEIERIAQEFTSHGVRAGVRGMGGLANANGVNDQFGLSAMNALIGATQMTAGVAPWRVGGKSHGKGDRYDLSTIEGAPGITRANATGLDRTYKAWNETDEYKNRVAAGESDPMPKLPWFKINNSSDNQAFVSAVNQYPYQAKIILSWMTNTIQATPGAMRDEVIEKLKDPAVVPLHIACDVVVGEHAHLADYIVPDTNPYESFGVGPQEGSWHGKGSIVRWPVVEPGTVELGDGRFASYETFLVDVSRACGVPGFGDNAIKGADGSQYPLNDAADYFLKAVANLAYDDEPVQNISESDSKLQGLESLPGSWEEAVTKEEWPKVLQLLSRGGRFWPVEMAEGEEGRSALAKPHMSHLFNEERAAYTNIHSGKRSPGYAKYLPEELGDGTVLEEKYSTEVFPFKAANYKARFRTVTMGANSPILRELSTTNYVEINAGDADKLSIADGDNVRLTNPHGDVMEGPAFVRDGIAPGAIGVAFGYGHIAYGAQDMEIDGQTVPGIEAIGDGIHLQQILDPTYSEVLYPFADYESAAPSRNGGMYKIEKA